MRPTLLLLVSRFAIPQTSYMALYFSNLPAHFAVELSIISAFALGAITYVVYRAFPASYWLKKARMQQIGIADRSAHAQCAHRLERFLVVVNLIALVVFVVGLVNHLSVSHADANEWAFALLEIVLTAFILFGTEVLADFIVDLFRAGVEDHGPQHSRRSKQRWHGAE